MVMPAALAPAATWAWSRRLSTLLSFPPEPRAKITSRSAHGTLAGGAGCDNALEGAAASIPAVVMARTIRHILRMT